MGDDRFEAWYRDEHGRVLAALTLVAGDFSVAGEAVDEAFLRAYERWGRVGAMASPAGWTYRVALNVLRRRHRRQRLEQQLHLRRARGAAEGPWSPPDWSLETWDALRRLPVRERTAVALRHVADLTTEEIADVMGIAPGTVGSTLHAARNRLADLLSERIEEVSDA